MGIRIRKAIDADCVIIAEFNARLAVETENRQLDPTRVRAGVASLLADPNKGTYFIAEIEAEGLNRVAGQLLITYEWSDWRDGNFWWIQSVYVHQDFRGQGVFRALFEHVRELAKARTDVCGLRLYMDADNATARRSYERLGMKLTDYQMFEMDFVLPHG